MNGMGNMNGMGTERVETRISLVLYGGVSLAVYISGTCQELLSLVRATAATSMTKPSRAEAAYRRLAAHAGADRQPMKVTVDVISGSSAGGLNAVFLGKALTQGGNLDGLTEIWRREADFLRLLNDTESEPPDGIVVPVPTRPTGILNGDRFFLMLFDALERMDADAEAERERSGIDAADARLVPAVDCFLTTTDLRGVAERVQLYRSTITELRHRGRFHFRDGVRSPSGLSYGDLGQSKNHLLAFAARATAAFPGAFHPAQWEQVMSLPMGRSAGAISLADNFFPTRGLDNDVPVKHRWYSDGGVMDNKPFAYALEPLTNRRADVPVDRRVMYVEPDPSTSVDGWEDVDFPSLDRYTIGTYAMGRAENIREDVAVLNRRNEAVNRLNESVGILFRRRLDDVIEQLRQTTGATDADPADLPRVGLDLEYSRDDTDDVADESDDGAKPRGIVVSWKNMSQAQHAVERGWGAVASEEFRWNSVVTDLVVTSLQIGSKMPDAAVVGKVAGPVRKRIEAWIRDRSSSGVNVARVGLYLFDVGYRLRRFTLLEHLLSDVQRRLNAGSYADDDVDDRFDISSPDTRFEQCRTVRARVNELYLELRSKLDEQRTVDFQQVLGVDTGDWAEDGPDIEQLLRDPDFSESLDVLITQIEHRLSLPLELASVGGREAILEADIDLDLKLRLTDAWLNYGDYDQLILPLAEVAAAELDAAEVIRISPVDAPSLVDELRPTGRRGADGQPTRRRKLGGNSLAHFGGFLDENWRLNDVLWGRLDAAEVIVRSILMHPDDDPEEAIGEIHHAILSDLAEDVARQGLERSPLSALLQVNAEDGSGAHAAARTQLANCEALDVGVDGSPLSAAQSRVVDDTATAFLRLLNNDGGDEVSWSVDLSMDNVRSTRGGDKITLLRRGARVAGKVLASAGDKHYGIDSGDLGEVEKQRSSYVLVGSLLVSTVMLAIGGPVRRLIVTGLLAAAGLLGLILVVASGDPGGAVVAAMSATSIGAAAALVISRQPPSRTRSLTIGVCVLAAGAAVVVAFSLDWLMASACVVFLTLLGLAIAFWFAVGWIRTLLIELGNPKPAPAR